MSTETQRENGKEVIGHMKIADKEQLLMRFTQLDEKDMSFIIGYMVGKVSDKDKPLVDVRSGQMAG